LRPPCKPGLLAEEQYGGGRFELMSPLRRFRTQHPAINSAAFTFPTPTPNGHAYTNIAMDQRYRAVSEIVANEKRSAAA